MAIIAKITSKILAKIRELYSISVIIPALYPTVAVATKSVNGMERESETNINPSSLRSLIRVREERNRITNMATIILIAIPMEEIKYL